MAKQRAKRTPSEGGVGAGLGGGPGGLGGLGGKLGASGVPEVREPAVDIFEDREHNLVVAEMPGIGVGDVRLEVKDDLLTITAERGDKKYKKEVLLPASFPREKMQVSCANGVLEIR